MKRRSFLASMLAAIPAASFLPKILAQPVPSVISVNTPGGMVYSAGDLLCIKLEDCSREYFVCIEATDTVPRSHFWQLRGWDSPPNS